MDMDRTDLAIINALEENARLSLRKIAKQVGVSTATVMHRLNAIEKQRAIKSYSALPDYDKLGYSIQAIIDVIVSKGKLFQVEKKIASHPSVAAVYDMTGHFDVMVIAYFKTRRGLDDFIKKIQTYDFVEKTETRIILNTIKEGPVRV
ncbi:MAG: Lrp/AsnC family transcriptional regulator [Candidatus Diapherotrites archaeon]|uniref:Lrp/AsnC family transcriptional regulator n=1 Tax=Candidatus Iainarchaeum sp. TaxID=3101447 RepID=A0A8T3YM78_9ARCH|nr:Lrp/AsnC family transcriptional regulator [Candidatus Diapherotrites archaeon]